MKKFRSPSNPISSDLRQNSDLRQSSLPPLKPSTTRNNLALDSSYCRITSFDSNIGNRETDRQRPRMGKTPIKMKAACTRYRRSSRRSCRDSGRICLAKSTTRSPRTGSAPRSSLRLLRRLYLVWTPIDVISQRLMIQTSGNNPIIPTANYNGEIDAFQKIVRQDGVRGLYRGFGVSILTSAPSNAVWWASNSTAHKLMVLFVLEIMRFRILSMWLLKGLVQLLPVVYGR
ncbi:hypothetical protein QQ045_022680 [Rhodiola kirilowii]